eukprot:scaffold157158_cov21-Prasinocladus_malaysianus.AAC.2
MGTNVYVHIGMILGAQSLSLIAGPDSETLYLYADPVEVRRNVPYSKLYYELSVDSMLKEDEQVCSMLSWHSIYILSISSDYCLALTAADQMMSRHQLHLSMTKHYSFSYTGICCNGTQQPSLSHLWLGSPTSSEGTDARTS